MSQGQGLHFFHEVLHFAGFRVSAPFIEKLSDHSNNLHQLKPLTILDINLVTSLGGVENTMLNF